MKNITLCVVALFTFFFVACKNEPKENHVARVKTKSYLESSIGVKVDDKYKVNQPDTVKKYWELKLRSEGIRTNLSDFEIITSTVEGTSDIVYLLLAMSEDNSLSMASLLKLEGGEFYFDIHDSSHNITICEGKCDAGCEPVVSVFEGKKSINCSPCAECLKLQSEIGF